MAEQKPVSEMTRAEFAAAKRQLSLNAAAEARREMNAAADARITARFEDGSARAAADRLRYVRARIARELVEMASARPKDSAP
jgi:hypothetical protein